MTDLHEMALEIAEEKLRKVNRLEVIDETGRGYIRYFKEGEHLTYSFQDDDRTLKIFVDTLEEMVRLSPLADNPAEDGRAEIQVDFTDEELLTYMKRAHEMDITFNQFVEQVLQQFLDEENKK